MKFGDKQRPLRQGAAAGLSGSLLGLLVFSMGAACGPTRTAVTPGSIPIQRTEVHQGIQSSLEITAIKGHPEQVQATLVLQNTSTQPLSFTFPSTQQYDFILLDEQDRQIWKWSEGKFFATVLIENALSGDAWVYNEVIPMQDADGRPLPPGLYRLLAVLTAQPMVRTEIDFEIPLDSDQ